MVMAFFFVSVEIVKVHMCRYKEWTHSKAVIFNVKEGA